MGCCCGCDEGGDFDVGVWGKGIGDDDDEAGVSLASLAFEGELRG